MSAAIVGQVAITSERGVRASERACQRIGALRDRDEVDVIAHQAVRLNAHAVFLSIAVSVVLLARVSPKWAATGTFTAITFAVGVGIPGASTEEAALRLSYSLSGGLLALLGVGRPRRSAR